MFYELRIQLWTNRSFLMLLTYRMHTQSINKEINKMYNMSSNSHAMRNIAGEGDVERSEKMMIAADRCEKVMEWVVGYLGKENSRQMDSKFRP